MSFKFASLVINTVDSFAKNKVPLKRIVLWIKQLEAIKSVTKAFAFLGERTEEVSKAEDVHGAAFFDPLCLLVVVQQPPA